MTSPSTLRKFGLDAELYERLYDATEGRCPLCTQRFSARRPACIDHDHRTGRVRGLLCRPCNYTIGQLHENSRWLRRAWHWLTGKDTARQANVRARHIDAPPDRETD